MKNSLLTRLYADGFAPIKERGGGTKDPSGAYVMPWPRFQEVVQEFFRVASSECLTDYGHDPHEAGSLLMNEVAVRTADLAQIKIMLTYCVRGERFCDGHWAAMVDGGHVRRLLERLAELGAPRNRVSSRTNPTTSPPKAPPCHLDPS